MFVHLFENLGEFVLVYRAISVLVESSEALAGSGAPGKHTQSEVKAALKRKNNTKKVEFIY